MADPFSIFFELQVIFDNEEPTLDFPPLYYYHYFVNFCIQVFSQEGLMDFIQTGQYFV